jgi:hypothetical protein
VGSYKFFFTNSKWTHVFCKCHTIYTGADADDNTCHLLKLQITNTVSINIYSCYSYRKWEVEHLIRLTDSFTWEELPTRDPDTEYLTNTGYIPLIQRLAKYITAFAVVFHSIQNTVRIVLNHDMEFSTCYPFDVSASPAYETENLTQVKYKILSLINSVYSSCLCMSWYYWRVE